MEKGRIIGAVIGLIIGILMGYFIFTNSDNSKDIDNNQLRTKDFELRNASLLKDSPNFHAYANEEICRSELMKQIEIVAGQLKSVSCKISTMNVQVLNAHIPNEASIQTNAFCSCEFLIA